MIMTRKGSLMPRVLEVSAGHVMYVVLHSTTYEDKGREGGRRGREEREEREGGEGGRRGREEREGGEGGRRGDMKVLYGHTIHEHVISHISCGYRFKERTLSQTNNMGAM